MRSAALVLLLTSCAFPRYDAPREVGGLPLEVVVAGPVDVSRLRASLEADSRFSRVRSDELHVSADFEETRRFADVIDGGAYRSGTRFVDRLQDRASGALEGTATISLEPMETGEVRVRVGVTYRLAWLDVSPSSVEFDSRNPARFETKDRRWPPWNLERVVRATGDIEARLLAAVRVASDVASARHVERDERERDE